MSLAPLFVLTIGLASMLHCASSTPAPVAKIDAVGLFAAALASCVEVNNTRATIDACRAAVEQNYCGPNGLLATSAGCVQDGGAE